MSDEHLRRLHRAWRETETLDATCAYDEACRRVGETSEPRAALYDRLRAALRASVLFLRCKATNGRPPDWIRVHALQVTEDGAWMHDEIPHHQYTRSYQDGVVVIGLQQRLQFARYTVSLEYGDEIGADIHYFPGDLHASGFVGRLFAASFDAGFYGQVDIET